MCARFSLILSPQQFQLLFGVELEDEPRRPEFFPTDPVPVVLDQRGTRQAELMRWGLIPPWAEDAKEGAKRINARAETLAEKPSFREPLRERGCVLPATCFYEWPGKVKHAVSLESGEPFAFAGLWEEWRGQRTCTLITCEPNDQMRAIHHRMPVLLRLDQIHDWLKPEPDLSLLKPFEGPLKIEPIPRQETLF